jgi:hypothetical protein
MLKDIKYKHRVYVYYTDEFSLPTKDIDKNVLSPHFEVGDLDLKDEDKKSYLLVRPEYYLWHPRLLHEKITAKIIWTGAYYINKDRLLITEQNVYDCWTDTANEIVEFIRQSKFSLPYKIPDLNVFQKKIRLFLDSLKTDKDYR